MIRALTLNPYGQVQWYDPVASDTQVPLFWQGAARQGAHFDIRLISTGPGKENRRYLVILRCKVLAHRERALQDKHNKSFRDHKCDLF